MKTQKYNLKFIASLLLLLFFFLGIFNIVLADFDDYWEKEYNEQYEGYDDDDDYGYEENDYDYDDDSYEWKKREYDDEEWEYRSYQNENTQDSDDDLIYDQYDLFPGKNDLLSSLDSDLDGIVDSEDKFPGENDFIYLVKDANFNGIADDLEATLSGLAK